MANNKENPEEGEETVYEEEGRENQLSDGEISPEEEAFMRGYDEEEEEREAKKKKKAEGEEEEETGNIEEP